MKNRFAPIGSVIAVILLVTGCASNMSGRTYSRAEARKAQTVQYGVIEHVRGVLIEGTKSKVGAFSGGLVGGIVGSSAGRGKGKAIMTILGALAGSAAGSAAEEAITQVDGVEITVRLDNGQVIAVVQQVDPAEVYNVGSRVRVIRNGSNARVAY